MNSGCPRLKSLGMNDTGSIGNQLDHSGLNLHAIFDLASLSDEMRKQLEELYPDLSNYKQLILFAHGGRKLWEEVQPKLSASEHPIDAYSVEMVTNFCKHTTQISGFKIIYPSEKPVGLQSLGQLAGWHHSSPFRVGINQRWGSWFAYRVAILADSDFPITPKQQDPSACDTCSVKPCVTSCPAKALDSEFSLQSCLDYRKEENSQCRDRCLARMACPIAKEHQYELEQIQYHYGISMKMIEVLGL